MPSVSFIKNHSSSAKQLVLGFLLAQVGMFFSTQTSRGFAFYLE